MDIHYLGKKKFMDNNDFIWFIDLDNDPEPHMYLKLEI